MLVVIVIVVVLLLCSLTVNVLQKQRDGRREAALRAVREGVEASARAAAEATGVNADAVMDMLRQGLTPTVEELRTRH
jgi:type II secretory pathway pseudopilin PulG